MPTDKKIGRKIHPVKIIGSMIAISGLASILLQYHSLTIPLVTQGIALVMTGVVIIVMSFLTKGVSEAILSRITQDGEKTRATLNEHTIILKEILGVLKEIREKV